MTRQVVTMCDDDYKIMEECIERAVTLEYHKGQFRRALQRSLPHFHRRIRVSRRDIPEQLTHFTIRYIRAVPQWLRQVDSLCAAAGIQFDPVREIIGHGFVEPPERHPEQMGLAALLDDAYLAHRTLEEINDQLQPACGMPLLPMDPMVANLVVRELVGEAYAGELDEISLVLGQRFHNWQLSPESLVAMILCRQRFIETPGAWPDFAAESGIGLQLPLAEYKPRILH